MFNIVGKRFWILGVSIIITLICVASIAAFGLKTGIDFASGSLLTISFENSPSEQELAQQLGGLGHPGAVIEQDRDGNFVIRTINLTTEQKTALEESLTGAFGNLEEKGFETIDPVIARQTTRIAAIAVVVASLGILLYVSWAFRRMPNPLHYGTASVIALLHDVLVVLGVYAIMGAVMGWEVNLMFITAILTVIGYSVNNTVVVFDRIRENISKGTSPNFYTVVNSSLVEILGRCLNTSLTTLFGALALALFIGSTIQNFAIALIIGVVAGTFSATFIAPLFVVVWEKKEWGRLLPWRSSSVKARGV